MASNDGGTTSTAGAGVVTTIVSPTIAELSFNAAEGAFYFTIGATSGTPSREVWRSPDGIAVATSTDVMYSIDQGATWRVAGLAVSGTPIDVYVGGGRPMIVTSSHRYMGVAAGLPAGVFA